MGPLPFDDAWQILVRGDTNRTKEVLTSWNADRSLRYGYERKNGSVICCQRVMDSVGNLRRSVPDHVYFLEERTKVGVIISNIAFTHIEAMLESVERSAMRTDTTRYRFGYGYVLTEGGPVFPNATSGRGSIYDDFVQIRTPWIEDRIDYRLNKEGLLPRNAGRTHASDMCLLIAKLGGRTQVGVARVKSEERSVRYVRIQTI